ncbi:hypothetical protein FB567DRAFT_630835 [Paraphoma chrysanthemicola]|uniref:Mid2 domain-containing protein n=1 Tax=Paraphoma chrysanthemicola TaxID=798071 RepID=A0A8K0R0G0_9PLEO|nr:hypothetical protein FB567DRAFT_630835 [Paraphoma chrysanthemicola]
MRSLLLGILIHTGIIFAQSLCFFSNGTTLPETPGYNEYIPCASGPTTICCGLNRADPPGGNRTKGFTKDECLPNGLCRNRWVDNKNIETVSYWNNFCTEKDVTSSKCLNLCPTSRLDFGHAPLTPCNGRADSERWCCGTSIDCCASNVGVISLAQVLGGALSSSTATSATTTTIPISSTTSSSVGSSSASGSARGAEAAATSNSTMADQGDRNTGLSTGAIAGIAVGVVASVALLGAAVFFVQRAKKYKQKVTAPNLAEAPQSQAPCYEAQGQGVIAEKDAYAYRSELPGAPPAELHSEPVSRAPGR